MHKIFLWCQSRKIDACTFPRAFPAHQSQIYLIFAYFETRWNPSFALIFRGHLWKSLDSPRCSHFLDHAHECHSKSTKQRGKTQVCLQYYRSRRKQTHHLWRSLGHTLGELLRGDPWRGALERDDAPQRDIISEISRWPDHMGGFSNAFQEVLRTIFPYCAAG